jgi:hypothetical protein
MVATSTQPPLNEAQMMLLKLFSRPMTEEQTKSFKKVVLDYYNQMLQEEVEKVIAEKNITRQDFDKLYEQKQRTK